jgi:hypothetical protein
MDRTYSTYDERNAYRLFSGNPEGKTARKT